MEKQQSNKQDEVLTDTGSQLRQARIERGVELDAVAAVLCIPASYVTAIEHNDLAELPSAVFVRGYVNAYARFLGVDLNGEFDAPGEHGRSGDNLGPLGMLKRQTRPGDPWVRWTSLAVFLVVLVASLLWWRSQGEYRVAGIAVAQAAMVTVDTSNGSVIVDPSQQESALGPARPGSTPQRQAPSAVEDEVLSSSNQEAGSDVAEVAAVKDSGLEPISLSAVFSDASWIEVRDGANGILFTGVKQAGESLDLSSTAIIDVVIGNAAAVKLSYNGAPVELVTFTNEQNVAKIKLGL